MHRRRPMEVLRGGGLLVDSRAEQLNSTHGVGRSPSGHVHRRGGEAPFGGVQIREGHIIYLWIHEVGDLPELPDLSALEMLHDFGIHEVPLRRLPDLPKGLQSLYCCKTMLQQLPDLPKGLHTLICSCNHLQQLSDLPESLRTLHCEVNQLQQLPDLPDVLEELAFEGNPLELSDNKKAALRRTYRPAWQKLL